LVLRLEGQRVTKVCFDYAVTLATESGFELRLETLFVIHDPDDEQASVDPEAPRELAAHVLEILQQLIDSADVEPSGALTVRFVDGHEIVVPPHPEFEAWSVVGPSGQRVVCLPGGGFSEWSSID
jgi:hypothetical protein